MLGPDGLAEHEYWPRKPPLARSALQGIFPEEEQDALVQAEPFICGCKAPAALG